MFPRMLLLVLASLASTLAAPDGTGNENPSFRSDYKYYEGTHAFYKFHSLRLRWTDAVGTCLAEGAVLPTPTTRVEAEAIVAQLQDSTNPDLSAWVGLHDMFSEGNFQSLSGQSLSEVYVDWAIGEPDDYNNDEDCVLLKLDVTSADVKCSTPHTFVCMKDVSTLTSNPSCETYDTGYNRTSVPNRCYKLHTTPRTWNDAYKICKAEQSNLVIIDNEAEAKMLVDLLAMYPVDEIKGNFRKEFMHIGINDLITDGVFTTVDGVPVDDSGYSTWAENQPDNFGGAEHCGSMYRDGTLNDVGCTVKAYFVCEKVVK